MRVVHPTVFHEREKTPKKFIVTLQHIKEIDSRPYYIEFVLWIFCDHFNKTPNMIHKLLLFFSTIAVPLLSSCGGRPQPPSLNLETQVNSLPDSTKSSLPKCTVNVYVENSASMDGYVKGVTEFEQSVYSYISDIKLAEFCESLNLNYINSQILKQRDDVEDFIAKLEPNTFKLKGGNRGTTDISNLFKSIMDQQGENDISILISDFVFSPGKTKDASQYLTNQQIGIKGHFATKLRECPNYSAVLYRLTSQFNGRYYNKYDQPTTIDGERPFFIWIMGASEQLMRLTSTINKKNMKGNGVDHTYCISNIYEQPAYGILPMPRIGRFKPNPSAPRTSILSAKVDKKNPDTKFLVSIGVDFSSFLLENNYLTDPRNYEVSNKAYNVEIVENTNTSSYTHIIKLSLDPSLSVINRGNIKISLLKKVAPWADELTDNDGVDIDAEGAMGKTFGLKYLIEGVYDAYKANNCYATFNLNIQ